ncbi:MAG: hypothetical protein II836_03385, partial [Clostridia bacterium]|nr:hypothetical protein [Clostridia bacterium]
RLKGTNTVAIPLPGLMDFLGATLKLNGDVTLNADAMADYLAGTDADGKPCSLYVENVGRLTGEPGPIRAVPSFLTDSETLAAALRGKRFRSEVHGAPGGVRILIFEEGAEP